MLVIKSERKLSSLSWCFHLVGLLVALAALTAIYVFVVLPIDRRHSQVLRKTSALNKVSAVEENVRVQNAKLTDSLRAADQKLVDVLDRIPLVPREADFLGQITTLAREVGLEIVDYRPGATLERDEYHEMTVSLSSEGSYAGICSFLHRINHLPRLSKVSDLKIVPQKRGEGGYQMDMTIAIFFAPKNKTSQTGESNNG